MDFVQHSEHCQSRATPWKLVHQVRARAMDFDRRILRWKESGAVFEEVGIGLLRCAQAIAGIPEAQAGIPEAQAGPRKARHDFVQWQLRSPAPLAGLQPPEPNGKHIASAHAPA
eukprot:1299925-Prorocentrum_lima.AAC.1